MATINMLEETANYLLNHCFLLGSVEDQRSKYLYVQDHLDEVRAVFAPLGYSVLLYPAPLQAAALVNGHEGSQARLLKYESILLLVLRLLYLQKRESLAVNADEVLVTVEEVQTELQKMNLPRRLDQKTLENLMRTLRRYNLARPVGRLSGLDSRIEVFPTVLLALPEVSWLAVNVRGCVAHVQVVERHRPPEAADRSAVTNIVARRSGLITKVEALEGQAMVLPGTTVTEGQLLISGVSETEHIGARFVHSMGAVWARTWYELSVSVPLQITQPAAGSRSHSRWALDIGKHRIKFYGKGSITGVDCDKITYYKPFTLPGGLRLPLTLVQERITAWEGAAAERTEQSARQEGEQQLLALLSARLPEGSTVTDTRFAAVRQGNRLTVVLKAECLEQIGQTVTLPETETTQR